MWGGGATAPLAHPPATHQPPAGPLQTAATESGPPSLPLAVRPQPPPTTGQTAVTNHPPLWGHLEGGGGAGMGRPPTRGPPQEGRIGLAGGGVVPQGPSPPSRRGRSWVATRLRGGRRGWVDGGWWMWVQLRAPADWGFPPPRGWPPGAHPESGRGEAHPGLQAGQRYSTAGLSPRRPAVQSSSPGVGRTGELANAAPPPTHP